MRKNIMLGILGWIVTTIFGFKATAQEGSKPNQKETQEIIIRKKDDKDTKVIIEITGDKVIVNGKPMAEFNEEGVTINSRKMIIRHGDNLEGLEGLERLEGLEGLEGLKRLQSLDGLDGGDITGNAVISNTFLGVITDDDVNGAKVKIVSKNSPAEKAGLQEGDIIYKVGDKRITERSDLLKTIRAMKNGDKVKVYFMRDDKKKELSATLGTNNNSFSINRTFSYHMPNGKTRSLAFPRTNGTPEMPNIHFDGNAFGDVPQLIIDVRRKKLGIKIQDTDEGNGVKVLEVEKTTPAETAGLLKDDIITEIAGKKITNTDEAREELQTNKDKSSYDIKAKRNGSEMTFSIKIPKKLKTANL